MYCNQIQRVFPLTAADVCHEQERPVPGRAGPGLRRLGDVLRRWRPGSRLRRGRISIYKCCRTANSSQTRRQPATCVSLCRHRERSVRDGEPQRSVDPARAAGTLQA